MHFSHIICFLIQIIQMQAGKIIHQKKAELLFSIHLLDIRHGGKIFSHSFLDKILFFDYLLLDIGIIKLLVSPPTLLLHNISSQSIAFYWLNIGLGGELKFLLNIQPIYIGWGDNFRQNCLFEIQNFNFKFNLIEIKSRA